MTHLPIRYNADGSRTYSNGYTYHPQKAHERKMRGPRFKGEEGEWFESTWLPPFVGQLDDSTRVMPETRPDYIAHLHEYGCACDVCQRPHALWWKRAKRPGVILSEVNLVAHAGQSHKLQILRAVERAK